mmetsp:Transcript_11742/g.17515  ORF Transcript_11742/g.17515 Transcript_11742/m.17515 type:complete len:260 (-) Transcript_11742:112-891(-)|eukprot:CAMPEP_0171477880 /NCGR_PEP_ID=MMETSP0946-20130122/4448_1 /TAXON_ID=109269 /ORGANISM="Vaucheria litorea, Strain CCMP2940" /LENGTH=259 /DNA_ID=CAMNT_0012008415 /DNA_START=50 /DNA_END=829 /DNA_ORIENTATION=-
MCRLRFVLPFLLALFAIDDFASSAEVRPSSELKSNCFDFPSENFNQLNCIKCTYGESPTVLLKAGSIAVDFTLHTLEGKPFNLKSALKEKPVVLIWGMYTCPAYEGLGYAYPFDECSFWDESGLVSRYHNFFTFVHLVGPEPHPIAPYTNFDSGTIKVNYWSTIEQPLTYETKKKVTEKIKEKTHPNSILLPDYLPDNPYKPGMSQAVWCTYGMGARTATVITQDGMIRFTQDWFHASNMAVVLDEILQGGRSKAEIAL